MRSSTDRVCQAANAFKAAGIRKGNTVGLYLPMIPEMAVAFYAALKIGAVIIPIFSGFGAQALATRLRGAAGCRLLVTADGSVRRGKPFAIKPEADSALESCAGVEKVVVVDRLGARRRATAGLKVDMTPGRDVWWSDFLAGQPQSCPTESLEAEDRSLIIFHLGHDGAAQGDGPHPCPAVLRRWPRSSATPLTSSPTTSSSGSPTSAG